MCVNRPAKRVQGGVEGFVVVLDILPGAVLGVIAGGVVVQVEGDEERLSSSVGSSGRGRRRVRGLARQQPDVELVRAEHQVHQRRERLRALVFE
jgi:hypothetical protein